MIPRRLFLIILLIAATLATSGCGRPRLTGLDVTTGPEHTLVMVRGARLAFTSVIWDAGLPSERIIPGGFLGGYMFSVPPGAAIGPHPVALAAASGRSASINFQVTAPLPYGAPRIDAVTIVGASFDAAAQVNAGLYVQGANIDVGAVVQIDGVEVATVAHKALRNNLYGVPPTSLAYPIYHFVALAAFAGPRPVGARLYIEVKNLDGQISAAFEYVLPMDAATLDSDGDDLPDAWEIGGYDADGDGAIDVNLPALGAHPYRRDIFLHIDTMLDPATGQPTPPIVPTTPGNPGTFDVARSMFAAAPILNPYTENGINLIIDGPGTVPFAKLIGFTAADNPGLGTAKFGTIKAASSFDHARRGRIYHYAIWAHGHFDGRSSGESDINLGADGTYIGPGDDLFVAIGDWGTSYHGLRSQVEILTHELGHNLGQRHRCNNDTCYNPVYFSVMSNAWALRSGRPATWRSQKATCLPIYYATPGASEPGGALPGTVTAAVDYSDGMGATLVEYNNSLNEPAGVCGKPVDWNLDGSMTGVGINADVDRSGAISATVSDFSNWRALDFRGPRMKGKFTP